jgi:flagellar biosynthesis/type III secretory pathway protein FliH
MMLEDQKKILEEASLAISKKFEQQIKEVNDNNIESLKNIYKGIESDVQADYQEYKDAIKKQTFQAESIATEKIKEEYVKLDAEIKDYKTKMIEKVNEDVYKLLLNISKMVLGKSLDLKDHEELIIDALNKAKKENIV